MRNKRSRDPGKIAPFTEYIISRLNEYPLTATRIYREIQEKGFTGKYGIVKNFIREVRPKIEVPAVYRYETKPGVQGQVDWAECIRQFSFDPLRQSKFDPHLRWLTDLIKYKAHVSLP